MVNLEYTRQVANEVRLLEEMPRLTKADIVTKLAELNTALSFQFLLETTKKRNVRIMGLNIQIGAYSAMLYDSYKRSERPNKTQIA